MGDRGGRALPAAVETDYDHVTRTAARGRTRMTNCTQGRPHKETSLSMSSFRYARPESLSEALTILDEHGPAARVMSGGTDVFVGLRKGKFMADVVVDVKHVPEASGELQDTGEALRIPATSVLTEINEDGRVQRSYPALVEAGLTVGSIQIRNRATLAGNICNASPAADTVLPLIIYGASVELARHGSSRQVLVEDFILGPGQTDLQHGELVTAVSLPWPSQPFGAAFARMTRRRGVDLATVNVCCSIDSSGRTRFAFGAAGPRPVVVEDATGRLSDPDHDASETDQILAGLVGETRPISDVRGSKEYRSAMLLVLARRTLGRSLTRYRATQEGSL